MSDLRGITESDLDRWATILYDIAYEHPHPERYREISGIADQLKHGPYRTWEEWEEP